MKTTKKDRDEARRWVNHTTRFNLLGILDDIDTLESENARLREAVRVIRDRLTDVAARIAKRDPQDLVGIATDISTVDALLKSEEKKE